jgi:two-component SAPR family response regulator
MGHGNYCMSFTNFYKKLNWWSIVCAVDGSYKLQVYRVIIDVNQYTLRMKLACLNGH